MKEEGNEIGGCCGCDQHVAASSRSTQCALCLRESSWMLFVGVRACVREGGSESLEREREPPERE